MDIFNKYMFRITLKFKFVAMTQLGDFSKIISKQK